MSKRNSRETLIFQCFSGVFSLLGVKDEIIQRSYSFYKFFLIGNHAAACRHEGPKGICGDGRMRSACPGDTRDRR